MRWTVCCVHRPPSHGAGFGTGGRLRRRPRARSLSCPNRPTLECRCVMIRDSNVVLLPADRTAAATVKAISPVLLAEYQIMNRIRLRRIADIAYDGLLNDREQESLAQIAVLFSANKIT